MLFLAGGVKLANEVGGIATFLDEGKSVSFAIYNCTFFALIEMPVIHSVDGEPATVMYLEVGGAALSVLGILNPLMFQKNMFMRSGARVAVTLTIQSYTHKDHTHTCSQH